MAKTKKQPATEFENAVDFLSLLYSDKDDQSTFVRITNNFGTAYNMTIGLGCPIQVDMECCPNIDLLREAVKRCKDNFALTHFSQDKLIVRQDDFHAFIPCLRDSNALTWIEPNPPQASIGNDFIKALDRVSAFADDKAERLLEAAIQLYGQSVIATCSSVVIEAWHGFNMPDGLLLPKQAAKMLHKIKKELISFGFSKDSITFYFADHSWLFSQLYKERLPDIRQHIEKAKFNNLRQIPHNFFKAVEEVAPFSTSGFVWVEGNRVSSHPFTVVYEGSGLSLNFDGPGHAWRRYGVDDLHRIRKIANMWDEHGQDDATVFFGEGVRGMLWHNTNEPTMQGTAPNDDEDIPF